MKLKRAYYYFYYKLYKFAILISDDALNEWKPLTSILVLQVLLLIEIIVWYSVITKRIFVINYPLITFLPIVAALGIKNYLFFLNKNKWKNYIDGFEKYDKKKKYLGGIIVLFIVAGIIASVILAFYYLSQIDWEQGNF